MVTEKSHLAQSGHSVPAGLLMPASLHERNDMTPAQERQVALELESVAMGEARYYEQAEARGESSTGPGMVQMKRLLPGMTEAIEAWIEKAGGAGSGRRHAALPYLCQVLPEQAAYLTIRYGIDSASRGGKLSTAAVQLGSAIRDHIDLVALAQSAPGLYAKVLKQVSKSTSNRHRSLVLRNVIAKYGTVALSWSESERTLLGAKLFEIFEDTSKLVEIQRVTTGHHKTSVNFVLTPEASKWFGESHMRAAQWAPVHLPMVVPPVPWTSPTKGGYLTRAIRRARMIQAHLPGVLDDLRNISMPAVYSAVNAIQATPWRVNQNVLAVMEEARASGPRYEHLFAEGDKIIPLRPSSVPADVPADSLTVDQREALIEWKSRATLAYEHNGRQRSKRVAVAAKLYVASRFKDEEAIYFPHYLDFRGRVYPFANHLNPQSDDVGKGLLEFAEGKPLGERGYHWLLVHTANLFGVDKVPFADRVQWSLDNMDALIESAENPLDGSGLWMTADSPWCALAACVELACVAREGLGFVSHIPVAMDGSCSGLQHYSAILRDPMGGGEVNLVQRDKPGDIYTAVARRAQQIVEASDVEALIPWRGGKVVRSIAKQPTMTLCYSATVFGMQDQVRKAVTDLGGAAYLGVDGDIRPHCIAMAKVLWEALGETVVAARDAMDYLKAIADVVTRAGLPLRWTAPNGLPVVQEYRVMEEQPVKIHYNGTLLTVKLATQTEQLDTRRQKAGIAPNFIHSFDSAHLMATVNLGEQCGIHSWAMIHDSFGTHAANVDTMNICLREAFIEQYSGDVLARLHDEVAEQLTACAPDLLADMPQAPPRGTLDLLGIRDAAYFFA